MATPALKQVRKGANGTALFDQQRPTGERPESARLYGGNAI